VPRTVRHKDRKYLAAIYSVRCTVNSRRYVGLTTALDKTDLKKPDTFRRWLAHVADLNAGKHPSSRMQADWDKFGAEKFTFEILEWTNTIDADDRERYWQRKLHPEYSNDHRLWVGKELTERYDFQSLVKLLEGEAIVIEKSELEPLKQRLAWLEQRVAVIDRRTRKPRKISPGQLKIFLKDE
jgi:hypothetical protein